MIAPSRVAVRGTPQEYTTRIDGRWAVVTAVGDLPGAEYQVRCVQEDGEWRVVLELPPLPEIERRAGPE
jgi:hypothetical protein